MCQLVCRARAAVAGSARKGGHQQECPGCAADQGKMNPQAFEYSRQELMGSCPLLGQQGGYHTKHTSALLQTSSPVSFTPCKLNTPETVKPLISCWAGARAEIAYSEICAFDNKSDVMVFSWRTTERGKRRGT